MLLLHAVAIASETPDWHAAQARQFLKKGWAHDADSEVRAGLALEDSHVELNSLCVELARAQGDIDRALACASRGAAASSGDLEGRAALSQQEAWLRANFGWVELRGPEGMPRVHVEPIATGLVLDAELQSFLADAATRGRAGLDLPARVALPLGDYTVLGHPLNIVAAQTRTLNLPPSDFIAAAGRGRRLDAAAGLLALSGFDLANHRPGLQAELSLSFPLRVGRLGLGVSWELRAWTQAGQGDVLSPNTAGGLVRYGVPLELGGAVLLTPAAVVRAVMLPGLALACDGTTLPLSCAPGVAAGDELPVYANGWGVIPGAELALELAVGRVVLGVRGGIGHVVALVPQPSQLALGDRLVAFRTEPPDLHGTAWSGAATIGFGL
ncbi:MAG: hypothetical protein EXR71_17345 [Myxococcales bacterium]|nr:hypothetical protein [Myxococcales bacterium]